MAHNGEWGYKLLTEDWRCYDKYFGNALAVEGLSHRELELLQSLTYVWYYIYNRRFGELWQFVRRFHSEAWAMLKRLLMPARAATADEQLSKPSPGRTPTPALRKVS